MSLDRQREHMNGRLGVVGLLLASVTLAACQDSAASPSVPTNLPPVPITAAGAAGASVAKPAGGSSGAAGAAPSQGGSAGMKAPPGPVACGATMCMPATYAPAPDGSDFTAPCCVDATMGSCGYTTLSGAMCLPPPAVDPECPKGPMGQPGCCLSDGKLCGIDATAYGSPGCFDHVNSLSLDLGVRPVPTHCDGTRVKPDDFASGASSSNAGGAGGASAGTGGAAAAGRGGAGGSGGAGGRASGGSGGAGGSTSGSAGSAAGARSGAGGA